MLEMWAENWRTERPQRFKGEQGQKGETEAVLRGKPRDLRLAFPKNVCYKQLWKKFGIYI